MTIFIGIVLFIVGTLAAFVTAVAGIAYLRTLSVYMGLKKLYRASFNTGMLMIAALVSALIAQMLMSGNIFGISGDVVATQTPAAEFEIKDAEDEYARDEMTNTVENDVVIQEEDNNAPSEINETDNEESAVENIESIVIEPEPIVQQQQPATVKSTMVPSFTAWSNVYKGHEYAYIEIEGGTPYVYAPNYRGSFWYDLNNISSRRESSNIVVMANAGLFDTTSLVPLGTTIQNSKVVSSATSNNNIPRTLVVDDSGNVGYTANSAGGAIPDYIDAVTGETVTGRKIVSAVYGFGPVVLNGEMATKYRGEIANGYRARQMFCVRAKDNYTIITNTGEGENSGGWNFDDMAEVALRRGCASAFSLDGGGSTSLAWRTSVSQGFQAYAATERNDPTFIVFTADNLAPSGK